MKRLGCALLCALLLAIAAVPGLGETITVYASEHPVTQDGWYDTMEEVCVYLDTFGALPGNYLTKNEAKALGWVSSQGNLWRVAKGKSIGGDRFGNYEGLLPEAKGRRYTECDIGFDGGYRGGERVIFSNDGLLFYTRDHYESFDEVEIIRDEAPTSQADGGLDLLGAMLGW